VPQIDGLNRDVFLNIEDLKRLRLIKWNEKLIGSVGVGMKPSDMLLKLHIKTFQKIKTHAINSSGCKTHTHTNTANFLKKTPDGNFVYVK
jgi:hypothetical protein